MPNLPLYKNTSTLSGTVLGALKNAMIIEYGIIKEIPSPGIVTVVSSVAKNRDDAYITNCIFANVSSANISVEIEPKVGDKVLILCPRRFDVRMFEAKQDDIIASGGAIGYSIMRAIAIPINQFRPKEAKNFISFKDGGLSLKLGYDKEQDINNAELTIGKKGDFTVKNNKTTATIAEDGSTTITVNRDGGSTVISIKADTGDVSIDAGKSKCSITSSECTINGHLKVT